MKKKQVFVFLINIVAFSSIVRLIYNNVDTSTFSQLIIPMVILFATQTSSNVAVLSIVSTKKDRKEDKGMDG